MKHGPMLRKQYWYGKFCQCCNPAPGDKARRVAKRRERHSWKKLLDKLD